MAGVIRGKRGGPDFIRNNIGESVTISYFTNPLYPFFYETKIVEIEIDGETQMNNWDEISRSGANALMHVIALLGLVATLIFAFRLKTAVMQDSEESSSNESNT